jgi:hypothetical protein
MFPLVLACQARANLVTSLKSFQSFKRNDDKMNIFAVYFKAE